MGHDQQGAVVRRPAGPQVPRQPGDALHVEVVGGLVEQEDVPVADQDGRERHAAALTTREVTHAGVPRDVGDEAGDDVADLRVAGPDVLVGLAHDAVTHRGLLVEVVGLVQDAHAHPAAAGHPARVGGRAPGEQAQQARLAVAVAAHDADAVPLVDAEGQGVEDDAGGVFETERFAAEQVCHPSRVGA